MEKTREEQLKVAKTSLQNQNEQLKGCLRTTNEATQISKETCVELDRQNEQMDRIEDRLDETKESLKKSKWLYGSVKSTFGMIKNFFTGPPKPKKKKEKKEKFNQEKEEHKAETVKNISPNKNQNLSKEIDQKNPLYKDEHIGKDIDEQDAILDEIMNQMGDLKGIAHNMANTLDEQNKKIDRIGKKSDKNTTQMEKMNKDMKNFLKEY